MGQVGMRRHVKSALPRCFPSTCVAFRLGLEAMMAASTAASSCAGVRAPPPSSAVVPLTAARLTVQFTGDPTSCTITIDPQRPHRWS
jgi:hypothetical protein